MSLPLPPAAPATQHSPLLEQASQHVESVWGRGKAVLIEQQLHAGLAGEEGVEGAGGSQFRLGHDIKIIPIKCIFHVKRLSWWNNLNARTGLYGIARKQSAPCHRPPPAARGKQKEGEGADGGQSANQAGGGAALVLCNNNEKILKTK